jgi:uncharacterized protein (TIGR02145 family)/prepilin-type N-terminal cleavage/methylation domain-containing protein
MKINNNHNQPAFTLIELLVVIAIIGILTALAVVSLQNSRRSARNAKRLSDVKQIQIALELYYQDNSIYPPTLIPGETLSSNSVTYMETIPYPPATLDGDCSTSSYIYSTSNNNTYYNINFCLSNNVGSLPSGEVIASPRGLGEWTCGEYLLDTRDYQSYTTIQLGNQCWMSENLNIGTRIDGVTTSTDNDIIEKYCYGNLESNCDIYGGMYQWNEAMQYVTTAGTKGICPDGWHVPSQNDWTGLQTTINSNPNYRCNGVSNYISKSMAAVSGWLTSTNNCAVGYNQPANNYSGFNVISVGYRTYDIGSFGGHGYDTYIWTSTENGANAFDIPFFYSSYAFGFVSHPKAYGWSIRCIKN